METGWRFSVCNTYRHTSTWLTCGPCWFLICQQQLHENLLNTTWVNEQLWVFIITFLFKWRGNRLAGYRLNAGPRLQFYWIFIHPAATCACLLACLLVCLAGAVRVEVATLGGAKVSRRSGETHPPPPPPPEGKLQSPSHGCCCCCYNQKCVMITAPTREFDIQVRGGERRSSTRVASSHTTRVPARWRTPRRRVRDAVGDTGFYWEFFSTENVRIFAQNWIIYGGLALCKNTSCIKMSERLRCSKCKC